MAPRLLALIAVSLVAASTASGAGVVDRKQAIDAKIERLRDKVASADRKADVLTDEIASVTARIRALQDDVDRAQARVATLEGELAVHRNRLATLTQIFELQTQKLKLLRQQHAEAERRLSERLVAIYQADDPNALEVVLSARDFADLLDQLDYLRTLGDRDRVIARRVAAAKEKMRAARRATDRTRYEVFKTSKAVEVRVDEQRRARDVLVSNQRELSSVRSVKNRALSQVNASKDEHLEDLEALQRASAELAARIQAAQSSSRGAPVSSTAGSAPSASGFIWPCAGTLTSGFGWRWGRMHEGIDIAAPGGTPIAAVASGTVIYAGWMGGYGNLVVVDHGGGIATAYAHQSSIAVGSGQSVGQGQTIGYVGTTGHSTGNHLHFEVRVNGSAVDPLSYL